MLQFVQHASRAGESCSCFTPRRTRGLLETMKSKPFRYRHNRLETPLRIYVEPQSGDRVNLVGLTHAALPSYYQRVQEFADTREQASSVVHFEGIYNTDPDAIDWREQGIMRDGNWFQFKIEDQLGLVPQTDSLVLRDSWQNHDLSLREYAILTGERDLPRRFESMTHSDAVAELPEYDDEPLTRGDIRIAKLQLAMPYVDALARHLPTRYWKSANAAREARALTALDQAFIAGSPEVTMLWGCSHHAGFVPALGRRGFVFAHEQWLTAIDFGVARTPKA